MFENKFLIVSRTELNQQFHSGFLRDGRGWAPLHLATLFTAAELENTLASLTDPADSVVIPAPRFLDFGAVYKAIAFRDSIARCIDCMSQDAACGETWVFTRVDGKLVPQSISAQELNINNLNPYEMIMFDGGNTAGDRWKHTFNIKQMTSYFVDENPIVTEDNPEIEVSLDGGQTFQSAKQGVRVVYRQVLVPGEYRGELHLNMTSEGQISDLWVSRDGEHLGHNLGTSCKQLDDMVSDLVEED